MPGAEHKPLSLEAIGSLAEAADRAAAGAEQLAEHLTRLREELATEKIWRRWAKWALLLLTVVVVVFGVVIGWLVIGNRHLSTENHQIIVALPGLVTEIDCNVRSEVGAGIHAIAPHAHFTLPATKACPAVTY